MSNFSLSLVLGLVAALADVLGALILVRTHWEKRYLRYFVALGAGFMLAAALLEMIPESFRLSFRWTPLLVLGGYCLIHLLEHTITPHFHFGEETCQDELLSSLHQQFGGSRPGGAFAVRRRSHCLRLRALLLARLDHLRSHPAAQTAGRASLSPRSCWPAATAGTRRSPRP